MSLRFPMVTARLQRYQDESAFGNGRRRQRRTMSGDPGVLTLPKAERERFKGFTPLHPARNRAVPLRVYALRQARACSGQPWAERF